MHICKKFACLSETIKYRVIYDFGLGFANGRQIDVRRGQCGRAYAFAQLTVTNIVQTILRSSCHVRCACRLSGALRAGRSQSESFLNAGPHFAFEHENQEDQHALQNVEGVRDVPQLGWTLENRGQHFEGPRNAHHDEEFHIGDVSRKSFRIYILKMKNTNK